MEVANPIYIGRTTNVAGETIAFPARFPYPGFSKMNIIIDITVLTGGGNMTFKVREQFSRDGATHDVTTGQSGALTVGHWVIPNEYGSASLAGNPALGNGGVKQILTTPGGTVSTFTADIWAVLFN